MGRTRGNAWPPEPRLFTHSRELWKYKIEEMSVKIGIKFFWIWGSGSVLSSLRPIKCKLYSLSYMKQN